MRLDITRIIGLQKTNKGLVEHITRLQKSIESNNEEIRKLCSHPTVAAVYNEDEFGRTLPATYFCTICDAKVEDEK